MKKKVTRESNPKRYRAARIDANVESLQKTIEKQFDLPSGSVKLVYPSGRKAYANINVGKLISHWEKNG